MFLNLALAFILALLLAMVLQLFSLWRVRPQPWTATRTGELVAFLKTLRTPERLELWRVAGVDGRQRSMQSLYVDAFPRNANLDAERCTNLANEIVAAAQNDADCNERQCLYEIMVSGWPTLIWRLGPIDPVGGGSGGSCAHCDALRRRRLNRQHGAPAKDAP